MDRLALAWLYLSLDSSSSWVVGRPMLKEPLLVVRQAAEPAGQRLPGRSGEEAEPFLPQYEAIRKTTGTNIFN